MQQSHHPRHGITLAPATEEDRRRIYQIRHDVFAVELGQHTPNTEASLSDHIDAFNHYIVARRNGKLLGFISVTPPTENRYSIDRYFSREALPFTVDRSTYEIRLLTVPKSARNTPVSILLMYAAFRWVKAQGGTRIMSIGRVDLLDFYRKAGLRALGLRVQSGAVRFELMSVTVAEMQAHALQHAALLSRLEDACDWQLGISFRMPAPCYHGGRFFEAIGDEFDDLDRRHRVINADVLDAWYPPSPHVLSALSQNLEWFVKTSPPTNCEGVTRVIARSRGVDAACILPGAGSSDLIYLALRQWLTPASRALILDPTYGEYAHVLERVVGCRVDRLSLSRSDDYALDPARLAPLLDGRYDLVVLVNPNSPTGQHVPCVALERVLVCSNPATRIWVDETYVEYAGPGQSLERFAASSSHVVVCKSMSKVYALSGVRAAYLCAHPHLLEPLRGVTPPWAMGLPAQVAAVEALNDPAYYADRYAQTHRERKALADALRGQLGFDVVPGAANFLLCHLPDDGPSAAAYVEACARLGLFIRDASTMGTSLGSRAIRIAVKSPETNVKMTCLLQTALESCMAEACPAALTQAV